MDVLRYILQGTLMGACAGAAVGATVATVKRRRLPTPDQPTGPGDATDVLPVDLEDAMDELRQHVPRSYNTMAKLTTVLLQLVHLEKHAPPRAGDEMKWRSECRARSTAAHTVARKAREELGAILLMVVDPRHTQGTKDQITIMKNWITDTLYNINLTVGS